MGTHEKNSYENTHIFDKTRLCKFYAKRKCKRGQACTFAHSEGEVQAPPDFFRTQLCADFARSGTCEAGSDCKYAHAAEEIRRAKTSKSGSRGGQGARKATDPRIALEVQKLEMMQQEVMRLHSQLLTLHATSGHTMPDLSSVPPGLEIESDASGSFHMADWKNDGCDWLDMAGDLADITHAGYGLHPSLAHLAWAHSEVWSNEKAHSEVWSTEKVCSMAGSWTDSLY